MSSKIDGFVTAGFEAVREAFATDPRGGSALCASALNALAREDEL